VPFDPFNGEPTSATLKAVLWVIDAFLQTSRTVLPMTGLRSVASVVSAAIVKSNESGGSLEIIDVCLLCVGYLSIFGAIYLMFQLSQLVDKVAGFSRSVSAAIEPVKSLARVAKVFVLLYLRIFILPMCLGACVLSSTNVLLQLPRDVWITFIASNIVGSIALTWVLGITYMLTVTLSVLQLREVLHPDVLAKNTRPQEAHLDLLSSLLMDTGINHVRRMCVSMVVYIVLMAFLVVAPIWIARYAAKILNLTHLLTVRTWYILPEIQLPFELASGHIAFLT
jgi:E3 ubiquitin-protein ligase MARCH6